MQRLAGLELRLLFEIPETGRCVKLAGAGVRLVSAGDNAQKGRLAAAVGPDQPDAVAGPQLERDTVEDRLRPKAFAKF